MADCSSSSGSSEFNENVGVRRKFGVTSDGKWIFALVVSGDGEGSRRKRVTTEKKKILCG